MTQLKTVIVFAACTAVVVGSVSLFSVNESDDNTSTNTIEQSTTANGSSVKFEEESGLTLAKTKLIESKFVASDKLELLSEAEHDDSEAQHLAWQANTNTPLNQISDEFYDTDYQAVNYSSDMQVDISIGDKVSLSLPNGETITANVTGERLEDNGDYTWEGNIIGQDSEYPVVVTQGENGTFGSIATEDGTYTLTTIDGQGVVYKNPPLPETHDKDTLIAPIIGS